MYQDFIHWRELTSALRNARGCGTESAVSDRVLSGWAVATAHPAIAPQSCPTTWAGPPMRSIRAATSPARVEMR